MTEEISQLEGQIESVERQNIKHEKQIEILTDYIGKDYAAFTFVSKVDDASFDYLAIGNSITIHPITDFWWGEWGMAASAQDRDYYHLVIAGLEKDDTRVLNSVAYNYYVWETQAHDRTETYEVLDKWLSPGIDLVTMQLSENASDSSTFEADFESLLTHISEKCGTECQIIVIDDFWSKEKGHMKSSVCSKLGISFVDLSDIRGKEEYKAGMGKVVYGTEGEEHIIEHSGVAGHPGDEGMVVIAERVLISLNKEGR